MSRLFWIFLVKLSVRHLSRHANLAVEYTKFELKKWVNVTDLNLEEADMVIIDENEFQSEEQDVSVKGSLKDH